MKKKNKGGGIQVHPSMLQQGTPIRWAETADGKVTNVIMVPDGYSGQGQPALEHTMVGDVLRADGSQVPTQRPSDGHAWVDAEREWFITDAEHNQRIYKAIDKLEAKQHRPLRALMRNPSNTVDREYLEGLDDEILALRADIRR